MRRLDSSVFLAPKLLYLGTSIWFMNCRALKEHHVAVTDIFLWPATRTSVESWIGFDRNEAFSVC